MSAADTPPAPWIERQAERLLAQRGHAWLLQGPSGLGQCELALALVRAWLCERPCPGACGQCPSCHAVDVYTHADLLVLMPETLLLEQGRPLDEKAQKAIDEKLRKPSREIRIEAMRDAIEFAQRTSARGRGKAVLVYPAERMNTVTANALLKTLEEPAGDLRFVLASEASHLLLPTIRSRCLTHTMDWPSADDSLRWLASAGLEPAAAGALLQAAGGRPDDALRMARLGRTPAAWRALPGAVARGEVEAFAGWSPAEVLDALQKLCHDLLAVRVGAMPRYFPAADLPRVGGDNALAALTGWSRALVRHARTVEHPYNAGLMLEALVSEARQALHSRAEMAPP